MVVPSNIAPVMSVLLCLALGSFVSRYLKSPRMKGRIGEWRVRWMARRLGKQGFRTLHNVTLKTPGGTTQIDHVLLSRFGCFVLETKNMKGWISGSEHEANWTQQFPRQSFSFQNPLRQNYKHLKALEATLGVTPEHLHSVIVFVGSAVLKTEMPPNVTHGTGFVSFIRTFQTPVFSEAQVEAMHEALRMGRLAPTRATQRAHVQHLKQRNDSQARCECPKCGSRMVLRTARAGAREGQQFWGCSAYPECRVTQAL
ncbi:nuclease-related domain-containing protein [Cobetia sp. L2A1]|uniref:nuclease-related domain-containing protein n=1 Tax=Cobetia sp. L2A1 TaxID=2686360 RepID=UPI001E2EF8EF|nr:NERD domain-containing protein [Cobetia sp. L2A1]